MVFTPQLNNPPRAPTPEEITRLKGIFPKLGNFTILAEASDKYNCLGWVRRMEQDLSDTLYWTQQILNEQGEFLPPLEPKWAIM
jgi:hypothetical protein